MVVRYRHHQTKEGKPMGFATLEDIQGNLELVLFPKTWENYGKLIQLDAVLTVWGRVDNQNGDPKILVDRIAVETLSGELPQDSGAPLNLPGFTPMAMDPDTPPGEFFFITEPDQPGTPCKQPLKRTTSASIL